MKKNHEIPIKMLKILACLRNLRKTHPSYKQLLDELALYSAGHYGEKSIDYYLKLIFEKDMIILNSLRIPLNGVHFQIDTLLLTTKTLIILEIKNMTGTISFDHAFGTMIQDQTKIYQDPITQVNNQKAQLNMWLKQNGFHNIPIDTLVVFVNKNVRLIREGNQPIDDRIIMSYRLRDKYNEIQQRYKRTTENIPKEKIAQHLTKAHTQNNQSILETYELTYKDFSLGVKCPTCLQKMKRIHSNWVCKQCKYKSRDTHVNALKDYYLIFGPRINNAKARLWLDLQSPDVAKYLIQKMNPIEISDKRNRIYEFNFNYQQDFDYLIEFSKKLINK